MKTMSPRKFSLFLLGVAAFIAGCVFVGMHISLPKMPIELASVVLVGLFLLWLCGREMICVPLKNSFLVDGDGQVVAYYATNRFIRTRVLEESGCRVVPHVFVPIHGNRDIQIAHGGQVVRVGVSAIVRANTIESQEYFNAFLCDKWVRPPEEQVGRLLADFLTEHSEWMSGMEVLYTEAIKNKLSDRLDEKLPSLGLYFTALGCCIDTVSNFSPINPR